MSRTAFLIQQRQNWPKSELLLRERHQIKEDDPLTMWTDETTQHSTYPNRQTAPVAETSVTRKRMLLMMMVDSDTYISSESSSGDDDDDKEQKFTPEESTSMTSEKHNKTSTTKRHKPANSTSEIPAVARTRTKK